MDAPITDQRMESSKPLNPLDPGLGSGFLLGSTSPIHGGVRHIRDDGVLERQLFLDRQ